MTYIGFPWWGASFCVTTWIVVTMCCVVLLVVIVLPVAVNIFVLNPVDGTPRVFTPDQSLPKVLYFLLEELRSSANCFDPMDKCTYDTILSIKIMVTIPL